MESTAQTCTRLLGALETLVAEEGVMLQARDFAAVVAIQQRAAPLVEHLATHGPAVADPEFLARLSALQSRRRQTGEWLAVQIELARAELQQVQASERRVARVVPAYGRSHGTTRSQVSLAG